MVVNVSMQQIFKKIIVVILEPRNLNPFKPHCVHSAEVSLSKMLKMLPACRATDPDLCLLWMRADEKTNSPHASIPPAGSALDCPFKFERFCCLDEPAAQGFWRLLWVLSGTSQAPACFASIIIYQATTKEEGSALAPGCVK